VTATGISDLEAAHGDEARLESALARIIELETELATARRSIDDLTTALESNRDIGAAIGIVMATRGVPSPAAFDLLRQASQARHTKLRDIAREVLETGRLAPLPTAAPRERRSAVPAPPPRPVPGLSAS
jgi:ANTAR domain